MQPLAEQQRLTRAAADDFGHLVHRVPETVLAPATAAGVAAGIASAARDGRTFAPRGQGHSTFGRAQTDVAAAMAGLRGIGAVEDDRVTVEAGATWREVLAATLPHGRTPPVLADYLDLSVGGTLAVGGTGPRTYALGAQTDHVLELEVVTGTGEVVRCSADRLFDAVRAGLGQVAVITRATLELVPAPSSVRWLRLFYPDLAALLAALRTVAADGRFDALQGSIAQGAFRLDAARYFSGEPPDDAELVAGLGDYPARREPATQGYLEHVDRLAPLEQTLRDNGVWFLPHPWLATFVGEGRVEQVVGAELEALAPEDLGMFGQVLLSPLRRSAVATPLLRLPDDELCFAFTLIRFPETGDGARLVDQNRAIAARVRAAGGTVYPVGALPLSAAEWREHFGEAFGPLAEAKARFDPGRVLTPGYEVFG